MPPGLKNIARALKEAARFAARGLGKALVPPARENLGVRSRAISPMLCAGCGAAVSYYFLAPLFFSGRVSAGGFLAMVFAPVAALCFFHALVSFPPAVSVDPRTLRALRTLPMLLAAFCAGFALGISAGARASRGLALGIPAEFAVGISGVLLDDPRLVAGGSAMATLSLRTVSGAGGARATARGEITVFFREANAARLREFGRGTEVFADGRLQVSGAGAFGGSTNSYIFSADSLHVTAVAGPLDRFRTSVRLALADRLVGGSGYSAGSAASESAWGGLALALLLGVRDNLDSGLTALYRGAGISYILALSGMHLAVIIALVSFLLKKLLGLRLAAIAGAVIIIAYCFVIGPLPSLYRAALMYLLGVLAALGMLRRESLSILSMAFLVQLAFMPRSGMSLSFVLSYLAMLGILVLGKSLGGIFRGALPRFFLDPLALSVGAFVGTAWIVALVFGDLRPVGIFAGIIVAPLTTAFMVGAMIWLALDAALPALSAPIAWLLSLLYQAKEEIARLASLFPSVSASPRLVLLLSLLTFAFVLWLDFRLRAHRNRLEPFA